MGNRGFVDIAIVSALLLGIPLIRRLITRNILKRRKQAAKSYEEKLLSSFLLRTAISTPSPFDIKRRPSSDSVRATGTTTTLDKTNGAESFGDGCSAESFGDGCRAKTQRKRRTVVHGNYLTSQVRGFPITMDRHTVVHQAIVCSTSFSNARGTIDGNANVGDIGAPSSGVCEVSDEDVFDARVPHTCATEADVHILSVPDASIRDDNDEPESGNESHLLNVQTKSAASELKAFKMLVSLEFDANTYRSTIAKICGNNIRKALKNEPGSIHFGNVADEKSLPGNGGLEADAKGIVADGESSSGNSALVADARDSVKDRELELESSGGSENCEPSENNSSAGSLERRQGSSVSRSRSRRLRRNRGRRVWDTHDGVASSGMLVIIPPGSSPHTCARCGGFGHRSGDCDRPFAPIPRAWPHNLQAIALNLRSQCNAPVEWI